MHPPRKYQSRALVGRQAELLGLIMQSIKDQGRPPTMHELKDRMRTGHQRIQPNVERLIELGYLRRGDPLGTLRVKLP